MKRLCFTRIVTFYFLRKAEHGVARAMKAILCSTYCLVIPGLSKSANRAESLLHQRATYLDVVFFPGDLCQEVVVRTTQDTDRKEGGLISRSVDSISS